MRLAPQQIEAYDAIMRWFNSGKQTFALAGYAGTGKTTLAKHIADKIGPALFLAYTGKAADVLRKKGCTPSATIHSAIYEVDGEDENGDPIFSFNGTKINMGAMSLIIVDEYSMLPSDIQTDLEKLGKRILYLGDPFQLPPVGSNACRITADMTLTEIHRQALDSPILRAATLVREGGALRYQYEGDFRFIPAGLTHPQWYLEADQVVCGYNKTRQVYNAKFREMLGFSDLLPQKTEKLICLKNQKQHGIYNGMMGAALEDAIPHYSETYRLDFEHARGTLEVWDGDVLNKDIERSKSVPQPWSRFDYGYAITCHKSQGSEFDNLVVINEPLGKTADLKRCWLYTAITRGREKVLLVQP